MMTGGPISVSIGAGDMEVGHGHTHGALRGRGVPPGDGVLHGHGDPPGVGHRRGAGVRHGHGVPLGAGARRGDGDLRGATVLRRIGVVPEVAGP